MYEHDAPAYRAVSSFVLPKDLVGSEFFGAEYQSGEYVNGILHEDAASLSFPDESFDLVISNDVFEHVYDYERAFREACRVLKKRGKLIFTVPFNANNSKTELRTVSDEGKISYLMEPVYHDNPVEKHPPLLVYQIFGWDILDLLEKCGFSDAYAKVYYGMKEGYLGYLPMYFEAYK